MSDIDREYYRRIHQLSGQERVAKTLSMFDAVCEMLRTKIIKNNPDLSDRAVKIKIAEQLYSTDTTTQTLIAKMKKDESTTRYH